MAASAGVDTGAVAADGVSAGERPAMNEEYIDELRNDHLGLVGGSAAMVTLRDLIRRVAPSERPVLILGAQGVGKWAVAEAIHRVRHVDGASGSRLGRISCSEIGAEGIEQVLFGVGEGQEGLLGEPGTVVLDDVDGLPMALQARLSQALQSGMFQARGGGKVHPIVARVMAITTRSLARCVREQTFRADLLYELGALTIPVPSLDERRDDIPALVNHFLRLGTKNVRFSGEALDLMAARPWPGSVQELRNLVERVVAFAREPLISREALFGLLSPTNPQESVAMSMRSIIARLLELPVENKLAAVEAALLEGAMRASSGNKSAAARLLGVHRKAVERKLEKHRVRSTAVPETAVEVGELASGTAAAPLAGDAPGNDTDGAGARRPANWQHMTS
jgi:DNA-binding NtrC family response regulator